MAQQKPAEDLSPNLRFVKNFACGGVAGMAARTVIAPVERIKIIYQTRGCADAGWSSLVGRVVKEGGGGLKGAAAFWKGNSAALYRVFPYLGIQLSANEKYRSCVREAGQWSGLPITKEVTNLVAGGGAGATAVIATYPLDLARARMALLQEQGHSQVPGMAATIRGVYAKEGSLLALYSGAGISCTGAAIYCGLKFASYDASKDLCRRYVLADPEGQPTVLHRALSGGLAGLMAQTFVYPFDVLRRRLQTGGAEAKAKYPSTLKGFWRLYSEEGVVRGLYRGCSLNYLKTVPNTTVYLALFDMLKDAV